MTSGQTQGELWSSGARAWATFMEPNTRPLYDAVHAGLGVGPGTRLLDIGCGPGGAAALAAARGAEVCGLDLSPGSIEVARERLAGADFRVGDMASLPWADGAFSAITAFNSLQFAGDPGAVLLEVRRVLAPGGRVGIAIWAAREKSQQPKIIDAIAVLAPPQPANASGPFTLSSQGVLESVMETAGLLILSGDEVTLTNEYPDVETACRALMAGAGAARAIGHSGEQRVRQAIADALEPFRTGAGGYRLENHFRFLIAESLLR